MKIKILSGVEKENDKYNWTSLKIGEKITIQIEEVFEVYSFEIENFKGRNLYLKNIFGETIKIDRGNFLSGHIQKLIFRKKELKSGDVVETTTGQAIFEKRTKKGFSFKCLKCNENFNKIASQLSNFYKNEKITGCPYCSCQKIKKGVNDIKTTHPHLIKYFKNEEEAEKYSKGSCKKVDLICEVCHKESQMSIGDLTTKGFRCRFCGEGNSYPEKLFISLLDFLNVNYVYQLSKKEYSWIGNYKYDFFLTGSETIVELHGGFHYKNTSFSNYKDVQLNDLKKLQLAKRNGISNYIVIDCRNSVLEEIKNNIEKSKLTEILDLSKVSKEDWLMFNSKTRNNSVLKNILEVYPKTQKIKQISKITGYSEFLIRKNLKLINKNPGSESYRRKEKVKELWLSGERSTLRMSLKAKTSQTNVVKILKKLNKEGEIKYNPKDLISTQIPKSKKVRCLNDNKEFKSLKECCFYYQLDYKKTSSWLTKKSKCTQYHANGEIYNFVYIDE